MHIYKKQMMFLMILVFALAVCARADVTVSFQAGTSAGWDFHELSTDIARNNTVGLDDLSLMASQWLQSSGEADLDGGGNVDFVDYALLVNDFGKQAGDGILLQTIYGSAQNSAGQITANTAKAMTQDKGCSMAFAVPQNTTLGTGIFKCYGSPMRTGENLRIRLYNVTGKNYLLFSGHPAISKSDPGSGGTLLFDVTATTPSPVPSHSELGDGRTYVDMVINFGSLPVTAGEYLFVFDGVGPSNTWGSMVRGNTAAVADAMGKYSDGTALPKRATVSVSGITGNTFHYELATTSDTNYTARSYLLACQITTTPPVNQAPQANAGTDRTIINPVNSVNLDGTVTDDDLPNPPAAVTTQWTQQSGPGTVTFGDATAIDTTATFSAYGVYVLRLTANDGALSSYDEVQITYLETAPPNSAPVVNAGPDQEVASPSNANLDGTVTDDGLPNPPGVVTTQWTVTSGPGTVTFGDASAIDTTASFSALGTYVLRLTANDSNLASFDEVTITYTEPVNHPQNEPPLVNAGPNLWVTLSSTVTINATVTDDGKPSGSVTKSWSKVSGPGTVTFGSPSSEDTTVSFSAAGTYVLRLTGNDSALSSTDDITVVVQAGNTYHVATSGNDGNAGSSGSPWKTIQHAVDTVSAGDTILVHAGTYTELVMFNKSGSDAAGYIILRNYGSDTPILDGGGAVIDEPALITINDQHHIFVCGFEMRNLGARTSSDTPAGVWVRGTSHHIALCGNIVHNITNTKSDGNAHGIAFYGSSSSGSINNIWVEDNEVRNCTLGWSESMVLNGNVDGFTVKDNVIHDNDNIGIDFIGFEGTCPNASLDQARNGTCVRNTVYNIDSFSNPAYGGERSADGIYVDGGTNIVIERNTIHHSNLGIEVGCEHGGKTVSGITVRSNVVYSCQVAGLIFGGYDSKRGSVVSCNFFNNTLYGNNTDNQTWAGEIVMQFHCSSDVIKNNAVYAAPGRMLVNYDNTTCSGNTFDYNVYYGSGAQWLWSSTTYSTFANYKTGSSQDSHSLNTDTQYADAANLDFHIWSGSPCVNAGDPGLTYTGLFDIDGQNRKQGSNADIGADENQ